MVILGFLLFVAACYISVRLLAWLVCLAHLSEIHTYVLEESYERLTDKDRMLFVDHFLDEIEICHHTLFSAKAFFTPSKWILYQFSPNIRKLSREFEELS